MKLKVLLPFRVFEDLSEVEALTVDTSMGNFGFLPNRMDAAAVLVPGILIYRQKGEEHYIAIDAGLLVKTGKEIIVSVRHAMTGADLGELHQLVEKEFLKQNELEQSMKHTLSKLEAGFLRHFKELNT